MKNCPEIIIHEKSAQTKVNEQNNVFRAFLVCKENRSSDERVQVGSPMSGNNTQETHKTCRLVSMREAPYQSEPSAAPIGPKEIEEVSLQNERRANDFQQELVHHLIK